MEQGLIGFGAFLGWLVYFVIKLVFYLGVIAFIIYEAMTLFTDWNEQYAGALVRYKHAKDRGDDDRQLRPDDMEAKDTIDVVNFVKVVYLFLLLVGLITGNRVLFAAILVLMILANLKPYSIFRSKAFMALDSVISIVLLTAALVNAYVWHLDWWTWLANFSF